MQQDRGLHQNATAAMAKASVLAKGQPAIEKFINDAKPIVVAAAHALDALGARTGREMGPTASTGAA
jgi:hypothetical protein